MRKEEFSIIGMHCAACVGRVEKAVSKLDGVEDVKVNLLTNKGSVTYTEDSTIGATEVPNATNTSIVSVPLRMAAKAPV